MNENRTFSAKRSAAVVLTATIGIFCQASDAALDFTVGTPNDINYTTFSYDTSIPGPGIGSPALPADDLWEEGSASDWVFSNPFLTQNYGETAAPLSLSLAVPNGTYSVDVHWFWHGSDSHTPSPTAAYTIEGSVADLISTGADDQAQNTTNLSTTIVVSDGSLDIVAGDATSAGSPNWYAFDNFIVTRTSEVPEPSAISLIAAGSLALLRRQRRVAQEFGVA